jgi:phosphate:Na+ symporter
MNIFNIISILGGLSMFLFGMRMMGDGLKESSSGTLKKAIEKLTSTPVKAFFMGLVRLFSPQRQQSLLPPDL